MFFNQEQLEFNLRSIKKTCSLIHTCASIRIPDMKTILLFYTLVNCELLYTVPMAGSRSQLLILLHFINSKMNILFTFNVFELRLHLPIHSTLDSVKHRPMIETHVTHQSPSSLSPLPPPRLEPTTMLARKFTRGA